jgi:hypothetical protein
MFRHLFVMWPGTLPEMEIDLIGFGQVEHGAVLNSNTNASLKHLAHDNLKPQAAPVIILRHDDELLSFEILRWTKSRTEGCIGKLKSPYVSFFSRRSIN